MAVPAPVHYPPPLNDARAPTATDRVSLAVETIGHLVPRTAFIGRVHSTFAHACNIECDSTLITVVTAAAGNGPTSLRLRAGSVPDLRRCFDDGETIRGRGGVAGGARATLQLTPATVWHPVPAGVPAPGEAVAARLRRAASIVAGWQGRLRSVIDREAAAVASALTEACAALDTARAAQAVARLIGWGEGLTPSGDDFVIGVCAGFDGLLDDDARRTALRRALSATIGASLSRTTRISAHHLQLAAHGHYSEPLLDVRDALLSVDPSHALEDALRRACALGATSGADMVAGLLAALRAWSPAPMAAIV